MKTACLLLHGFTGSPFEMKPLAPALESLGCTVEIPALPGHAATLKDFRSTFFPDWLAHAEERYLALAKTHDQVFIAGFSMGGCLALLLAARHAPAGIATLAAPIYAYRIIPFTAKDWRMLLVPVLKYLQPEVPLRKASPESRAIAPTEGYEGVACLPQLHSLFTGIAGTRKILPKISCPILLMHDTRDRLAWPGSALHIAQNISSSDLTLRYTHMREAITSHHMLTTHQETRDFVTAETAAFVARVIASPGKDREE